MNGITGWNYTNPEDVIQRLPYPAEFGYRSEFPNMCFGPELAWNPITQQFQEEHGRTKNPITIAQTPQLIARNRPFPRPRNEWFKTGTGTFGDDFNAHYDSLYLEVIWALMSNEQRNSLSTFDVINWGF